jgi:hypothetical protein
VIQNSLLLHGFGVTTVKGVNAAFGVNQLLLAGEEWMALRADADAGLGAQRMDFKLIAASAADNAFLVFGVQILFHGVSS